MKKIRLAIIGTGVFAGIHAAGIERMEDAELVAVCDNVAEKAKRFAEEHNVGYWSADYRDILARDDVDAVTIPAPDQLHMEIATAAMRAGKHVLCEKPMALSLDDCREMIKVAEQTGKKLMIGQICRYTPAFVKAKELIDKGEIGELFFVESEYAHDYCKIGGEGTWRVTPERHPILGGGCHAIDLLRLIAGNPSEVFAYANHKMLPGWPVDDCTIAVMKFPNGAIGKVLTAIGVKRNYTMRTVLYGSLGTIIVDNTSPTLSIFKSSLAGSEESFGSEQECIEMKIECAVDNHNTYGEIKEFCECIREDKPIVMTGEEGMATVAVCLAAVKSAKTGAPVQPEYE